MIALLGFGAARSRRRTVRILLIAGIPVLIVALAVWWVALRPDVLSAVWVYGPQADEASEFRVNVDNTRIQMTGPSNTFRPMVDGAALMAAVKRDHPQAAVTGDTAHIVEHNQGFTLHPAEGIPGAYTLEAEFITVSRGDTSFHIPFPSLSVTSINAEAWTLTASCDLACLTTYFKDFTNAHTSRDTVTVTTAQSIFTIRYQPDGRYTVSTS